MNLLSLALVIGQQVGQTTEPDITFVCRGSPCSLPEETILAYKVRVQDQAGETLAQVDCTSAL
jgi:hypothetical protein